MKRIALCFLFVTALKSRAISFSPKTFDRSGGYSHDAGANCILPQSYENLQSPGQVVQ